MASNRLQKSNSPKFRSFPSSPILNNRIGVSLMTKSDTFNSLQEMYNMIRLYFEGKLEFSRDELKDTLKSINSMKVSDSRSVWMIKRTKAMIKFILEKKREFSKLISQGEVSIFYSPSSQLNDLDLNETYEKLLWHLEHRVVLSKEEIKGYAEKIFNHSELSQNENALWLKIKGILYYLLRSRKEVKDSIKQGRILLVDENRYKSEKLVDSPLLDDDTIEIPASLLTNINFLPAEDEDKTNLNNLDTLTIKEPPFETVQGSEIANYSKDLFTPMQEIHLLSQQNYEILKSITQTDEEGAGAAPPGDKLKSKFEMHEAAENCFKQFLSPLEIPLGNFGYSEEADDNIEFDPHVFDNIPSVEEAAKRIAESLEQFRFEPFFETLVEFAEKPQKEEAQTSMMIKMMEEKPKTLEEKMVDKEVIKEGSTTEDDEGGWNFSEEYQKISDDLLKELEQMGI